MVISKPMLICIIVFVFMFSAAYPECTKGWTRFKDSCYHFGSQKVPWYGAIVMCKLLCGTLVEIEDSAEDTFIAGYAATGHVDRFWLGASDDLKEGDFIWSSSKSPLSYKNWHRRQPDNRNRRGEKENCLIIIKYGQQIKWNDVNCNSYLNYICERRFAF